VVQGVVELSHSKTTMASPRRFCDKRDASWCDVWRVYDESRVSNYHINNQLRLLSAL